MSVSSLRYLCSHQLSHVFVLMCELYGSVVTPEGPSVCALSSVWSPLSSCESVLGHMSDFRVPVITSALAWE